MALAKKKGAKAKSPSKQSGAARKGILAGGSWIIDQVKLVDVYPQREQLASIYEQSECTGGSPYNLLVDLALMGVPIPKMGAGLVGEDANGQRILDHCKALKIDTKLLKKTKEAPTSYTDVMTERDNGRRTFFHNRGANALWAGGGINFEQTKARIFHIGYLLLLDAMDQSDKKFGTKAAALLAKAQSAGLKTSLDVVSEDSERFSQIVSPALAYTDYCIINEIEAGKITGFTIRDESDILDTVSLKHAAGAILQMGVGELVVIHFPEGAFARTKDGKDFWQSSLKLPKKYIVGAAGAGDAFCAGVLHGIHEGLELQACLFDGVCAAAASLADATCTGGMLTLTELRALAKKYRFRPALERDR